METARERRMPEVDVKLLSPLQNATLGGIAGTIEVRQFFNGAAKLAPRARS